MKIRESGKYIGWIKVCNRNTSYRQQHERSKYINQIKIDLHLSFQNYVDIFFMKIWKCKVFMKIWKSGKYIGWVKLYNWNTSYRQQQELIWTKSYISFLFSKDVDIFLMKSVNVKFAGN